MAFSFTPGQIAPQGSQAIVPPGTVAPGAVVAPVVGPPSDSPFIFIREKGQPISIMACVQIVLIVVAILSILICGTMYSYSVYLHAQIDSKRKEIDAKDAGFPTYPYDDMLLLSTRMATLNMLLKNYISPISPLKFLENVVENQVAFNNFVLNKDLSGAFKITFMAETTNYKALIQQLAALNLTEYQRIIPAPKSNGVTESGNLIKISVTTPVLVQGKLPDDIVFIEDQATTSETTSSTTVSSAAGAELMKVGTSTP
jgi:hypothetical protein